MKPEKNYVIVLLIALSLMSIINLQTQAAENAQTIKKELRAVKTEQPPTIDGVLDDACWQDAPQATGFIDERTGKLAESQSAWVASFTPIQLSISDFISTMICPIKLWHAKPKIRHDFRVRTGYPLVLIRSTRTNFPTETFLWRTRSAPNLPILPLDALKKANGSDSGKLPQRL